MRFAGQRFRSASGNTGRFTADDGSNRRVAYRYQPQGLPQSRAGMSAPNASSMAKTEEPDFNIGSFAEPEFRI